MADPTLKPIQVVPPGLLGFLQLKTGGIGIDTLLNTLQPSLPMFDWLMQARALNNTGLVGSAAINANANARGQNAFVTLTVPAQTLWRVHHFTVRCLPLAAEYIRYAPLMIMQPGVGGGICLGPDVNDVITARNREVVTSVRDFWAPAGAVLGFEVLDIITAGNISMIAEMYATPMQI